MKRNKVTLIVGKEESKILQEALKPLAEKEHNIVFKRLQANVDSIYALWHNKDREAMIQSQLKEDQQ